MKFSYFTQISSSPFLYWASPKWKSLLKLEIAGGVKIPIQNKELLFIKEICGFFPFQKTGHVELNDEKVEYYLNEESNKSSNSGFLPNKLFFNIGFRIEI